MHLLGGKVGFSEVTKGAVYSGSNSCGNSTHFEVQL